MKNVYKLLVILTSLGAMSAIRANPVTYTLSAFGSGGGTLGVVYGVINHSGSSSIMTQGFELSSDPNQVSTLIPWSFSIALPNLSGAQVTSAMLTIGEIEGVTGVNETSSATSLGYYLCSPPLTGYCNDYQPATGPNFGGSFADGPRTATSGSSSPVGIGDNDLLALGFTSSDLLSGGSLLIQGQTSLLLTAADVGNDGFNASTMFNVSYSNFQIENAVLTLEVTTPEPSSQFFVAAGLVLVLLLYRRVRPAAGTPNTALRG